jgi:hypothetical protein
MANHERRMVLRAKMRELIEEVRTHQGVEVKEDDLDGQSNQFFTGKSSQAVSEHSRNGHYSVRNPMHLDRDVSSSSNYSNSEFKRKRSQKYMQKMLTSH